MVSPFPGMDPFIESAGLWGDFHASLCAAFRAELNAVLPKGFIAAIDLYLWIHEPDAKTRTMLGKPDVYVKEKGTVGKAQVLTRSRKAPHSILLPALVKKGNKYVKVLDKANRRVVTVLEILSPANKANGPDREGYLAKRNEILGTGVNLVEIDLLRGGERMPLGESVPNLTDYYVMVARTNDLPAAEFWPFAIQDPLPDISIPLDGAHGDVDLSLKKCVDRAYEEGRYRDEISYDEPLSPRLDKKREKWVKGLLPKLAKDC